MRARILMLLILALPALAYVGMPLVPGFFGEPTPPSQKTGADFPPDFYFEIADTPEARQQGLSGRADIPHRYGMLFVFPEPGFHRFWMREMLVPIDILWIEEDGTVAGIEAAVAPETYPDTFSPPIPVTYVLEMRAGESAALGVSVGDRLPLPVP